MQQITVTFDRVFDVRQTYSGRARTPSTYFGFENGQMRKEEARIRGLPTIRDGMTVTLLMTRKDDWQSIIGWVDHANGEVTAPSPVIPLAMSVIPCVFLFSMFASPAADHHADIIVVTGMLTILFLYAWATYRIFKVKRVLNDISAAMKQAGFGKRLNGAGALESE